MWHRIKQQSPLLASAPFVDPRNCTIATGMSITSFQFTPIELKSLQSAEEISIPAPVILPQKNPNTPFEFAEITGYISSNDAAKLANTGHLYHGIGDFDIGKICYGRKNSRLPCQERLNTKRLQDQTTSTSVILRKVYSACASNLGTSKQCGNIFKTKGPTDLLLVC